MKTKVLIVDDQAGVRTLLHAVLKPEGYEIHQAANGLQALDLVQREVPDFVFLDIRIPGMSGIEILKKIKEFNPNIRVIIMTAYSEEDLIKQTKELGAFAHLSKPFDVQEVRTLIKSEQHRQKNHRQYQSHNINWVLMLSTALLAIAAFPTST